MKCKFNTIRWLVLLMLLGYGTGCTDSRQWAIGAKGGTLGFGGELTKKIATDINTRVGFNMLDFSFDIDVSDIDYDFGLHLRSLSALVDWYIFDDPFHITGGFLSMNDEFDLKALVNQSITIGDNTYTATEAGRLYGRADIEGLVPYVGIGWGNPFSREKRWGFYSDIGVAFSGTPDVTLRATGTLSGDTTFQADLAKEERDIQDDLDVLKVYPVFTSGFYIRF